MTIWSEQSLLGVIEEGGLQESRTVEYKSSGAVRKQDKEKEEIGKSVCSFANAQGGEIFYGIAADDAGKPTRIDPIEDSEFNIDWFDQVIRAQIQPGVTAHVQQVSLTGQHQGKSVYVVQVEVNANAPHMAKDYRYYGRSNGRSVPLEDYQVRDIQNRYDSPKLSINFQHSCQTGTDPSKSYFDIQLVVIICNESEEPALYSAVRIQLPVSLEVIRKPDTFKKANQGNILFPLNPQVAVCEYSMNLSIQTQMPIWKGMNWEMGTFLLRPNGEFCEQISWECRAPHMSPRIGNVQFCFDGVQTSIKQSYESP